jgi:hypothetical protein
MPSDIRWQQRFALRLMAALDDLLLPWSIDLSLHHELPEPLRQHLARVGRRLVSLG